MIKFIALLFVLGACATTKVCPGVDQERVSMCRAEAACAPNFGQRYAAGHSGQTAQLMANTNMCISNHIEMQKSNAALGLMERALPAQTEK